MLLDSFKIKHEKNETCIFHVTAQFNVDRGRSQGGNGGYNVHGFRAYKELPTKLRYFFNLWRNIMFKKRFVPGPVPTTALIRNFPIKLISLFCLWESIGTKKFFFHPRPIKEYSSPKSVNIIFHIYIFYIP